MLVRDVMTSPAVTVMTYTTTHEALRLLEMHRITALPVVDEDGAVVGVVSEADLVALVPGDPYPGLRAAEASRVRELMNTPAVTIPADSDAAEAVRLMTAAAVRSLPVVLHDRIVGVVSRSDLVRVLAHTDDLIRYEVTGRLRAEGTDWTVDVTHRVVTIDGPITDEQRRQAETLARSVNGVADAKCR